jgi:hypothetical protein
MDVERLCAYVFGAALVAYAISRRSNSFRTRRAKGNIVVGDNSGSITQSYTDTTGSRANDKTGGATAPESDRVAWAIGIVGALIAAAQLVFDVIKDHLK